MRLRIEPSETKQHLVSLGTHTTVERYPQMQNSSDDTSLGHENRFVFHALRSCLRQDYLVFALLLNWVPTCGIINVIKSFYYWYARSVVTTCMHIKHVCRTDALRAEFLCCFIHQPQALNFLCWAVVAFAWKWLCDLCNQTLICASSHLFFCCLYHACRRG